MKKEDEMEALACCFFQLADCKGKSVQVRCVPQNPSWDPKSCNLWEESDNVEESKVKVIEKLLRSDFLYREIENPSFSMQMGALKMAQCQRPQ